MFSVAAHLEPEVLAPFQFGRYQPVPTQIAEEIVAKMGGRAVA